MTDRKSYLEATISKCNETYWNDGTSEISDQEYDKLVEELRKLDPENLLVAKLPEVDVKNKVVHKKPMLSLAKAYSLEEVEKWCKKVARSKSEKFLVQPKYDGISGKMENKVLSSRGTGKVGEDYTDRVPLVKFIGGSPEEDLLGEIVITDADWEWMQSHHVKGKSGGEFKNQRNAVAGIIGTDEAPKFYSEVMKQMEKDGRSLLTFMRYGVDSKEVTLEELKKNWTEMVQAVQTCGCPVDGVVVKLADESYSESLGATDHHPRGAVAFKFTNQSKWSKLTGIEWTMGKQQIAAIGKIEQVDISGTTVQNVKLQLTAPKSSKVGTWLLNGSLQIGDAVLVERAGDIIPHVAASKPGEKREKVVLEKCPFCGGDLKIGETSVECVNPDCWKKKMEKLLYAMRVLGFKGVAEKYAEMLLKKLGVEDVHSMMTLGEKKLRTVPEAGSKMVDIFMREQKKALEKATREQILQCLDVPSLGKATAKLLLEKFPREKIISGELKKMELTAVQGIGDTIAEEITTGLRERREEVEKTVKLFKCWDAKEEQKKPAGMKVCFTGKMSRPRGEMEQLAREHGLEPVDHVDAETKWLVQADPSSTSGKTKKAQKLGCEILSEEEFLKRIG